MTKKRRNTKQAKILTSTTLATVMATSSVTPVVSIASDMNNVTFNGITAVPKAQVTNSAPNDSNAPYTLDYLKQESYDNSTIKWNEFVIPYEGEHLRIYAPLDGEDQNIITISNMKLGDVLNGGDKIVWEVDMDVKLLDPEANGVVFNGVQKTKDGGFVAYGHLLKNPPDHGDGTVDTSKYFKKPFLAKFGNNGMLQWKRVASEYVYKFFTLDSVYHVEELSNGDIVYGGKSNGYDFVKRVDQNGNPLSETTWENSEQNFNSIEAIKALSDGGYMVLKKNDNKADLDVIKYNASSNVVWDSTISFIGYKTFGNDVILLENGEYVVGGYVENQSDFTKTAFLQWYDQSGSPIQTKQVSEYKQVAKMYPQKNGQFYILFENGYDDPLAVNREDDHIFVVAPYEVADNFEFFAPEMEGSDVRILTRAYGNTHISERRFINNGAFIVVTHRNSKPPYVSIQNYRTHDDLHAEYRFKEGEWQPFPLNEELDFYENGLFEYRAFDEFGNPSRIRSYLIDSIYKVETPGISVYPRYEFTSSVEVTIDYPEDAVKKEYRINDGEWQDYTGPITVTENGTVEARATNENGDQSKVAKETIWNIVSYSLSMYGQRDFQDQYSIVVTVEPSVDPIYPAVLETRINEGSWEEGRDQFTIREGDTVEARIIDVETNEILAYTNELIVDPIVDRTVNETYEPDIVPTVTEPTIYPVDLIFTPFPISWLGITDQEYLDYLEDPYGEPPFDEMEVISQHPEILDMYYKNISFYYRVNGGEWKYSWGDATINQNGTVDLIMILEDPEGIEPPIQSKMVTYEVTNIQDEIVNGYGPTLIPSTTEETTEPVQVVLFPTDPEKVGVTKQELLDFYVGDAEELNLDEDAIYNDPDLRKRMMGRIIYRVDGGEWQELYGRTLEMTKNGTIEAYVLFNEHYDYETDTLREVRSEITTLEVNNIIQEEIDTNIEPSILVNTKEPTTDPVTVVLLQATPEYFGTTEQAVIDFLFNGGDYPFDMDYIYNNPELLKRATMMMKYRINGGEWQDYWEPFEITENGTIEAYLIIKEDLDGEVIISNIATYEVTNIVDEAENPTEPEDPTEPTNPDNPSDPEEPTEPEEPSDTPPVLTNPENPNDVIEITDEYKEILDELDDKYPNIWDIMYLIARERWDILSKEPYNMSRTAYDALVQTYFSIKYTGDLMHKLASNKVAVVPTDDTYYELTTDQWNLLQEDYSQFLKKREQSQAETRAIAYVESLEAKYSPSVAENAQEAINAVEDETLRAELQTRFETAKANYEASLKDKNYLTALEYVEKAEQYLNSSYVKYAYNKIELVENETLKEELLIRIRAVEATIETAKLVSEATKYVEYAEKYKGSYIAKAQEKIDALSDGVAEKLALQARLNAVSEGASTPAPTNPSGDDSKAIANAEKYIGYAEKTKNQSYINKAQEYINLIADETIRAELQARLDAIKG